jgi:hypothetical protein
MHKPSTWLRLGSDSHSMIDGALGSQPERMKLKEQAMPMKIEVFYTWTRVANRCSIAGSRATPASPSAARAIWFRGGSSI